MAEPSLIIETSIFVDYLRGYVPARSWIESLEPGTAAISFVTAAELMAGCRNRREQSIIEKELMHYVILWDTAEASQTALTWYRQLRLSHNVGFLDCLIGACAYHHSLPLHTLNTAHFNALPGLITQRPY